MHAKQRDLRETAEKRRERITTAIRRQRKLDVDGKLSGMPLYARTDGRTNRKHHATAAHKLSGGGIQKRHSEQKLNLSSEQEMNTNDFMFF